jgi:serine/threonine-protein phosphatase 2A regulatory subunit B
MTGSYSNNIQIYGRDDDSEISLQADKSAFKLKKLETSKNKTNRSSGNNNFVDFNKKILHESWHPHESTIAVAATNNLFIFTKVSTHMMRKYISNIN